METRNKSYSAQDIQVLQGLDPVRARPGMYIGGTGKAGLHHLIWEIVDNSVDEAINGHATTISVTLSKGSRTISIKDNGRGIPVDIHPVHKKPALELILTTLHAGGKFDQNSYKTSGGLHGVGSSVVNALSSSFSARIRRGGKEYEQDFRRGKVVSELRNIGPSRLSGTRITFTPDEEIFGPFSFDPELIREQLEVKSYINKGLRIQFKDEGTGSSYDFHHEGGLADFLKNKLHKAEKNSITPQHFVMDKEFDGSLLRLQVALTWTDSPREHITGYVNGISTSDGGTHEQGFKDAITRSVRNFMDTHDLHSRGLKLSADDIREGLTGLLSVFISEPQFQGQTKDKLNNPEIRVQVEGAVRPILEQWLHDHKEWGQIIVTRATQAARARMASRAAANQVRRKSAVSHRLNLPGKLADCSSTDPSISELFIVEGDSAGGSAKQGRDRNIQAILPLRGKVLNTEQATLSAVLKNQEINNIIQALGCGVGKDFAPERLRYDRVILLMDADVDGHHIATLLLTFFYRYLPKLIEQGHVYIAQPPLYKIEVGKDTHWASDDDEKERILKKLPARYKPEISRFKGLGEMMPKTLYNTTLNPKKRRLLKVEIPADKTFETDQVINQLMGKDAQARFRLIMDGTNQVEELDI